MWAKHLSFGGPYTRRLPTHANQLTELEERKLIGSALSKEGHMLQQAWIRRLVVFSALACSCPGPQHERRVLLKAR